MESDDWGCFGRSFVRQLLPAGLRKGCRPLRFSFENVVRLMCGKINVKCGELLRQESHVRYWCCCTRREHSIWQPNEMGHSSLVHWFCFLTGYIFFRPDMSCPIVETRVALYIPFFTSCSFRAYNFESCLVHFRIFPLSFIWSQPQPSWLSQTRIVSTVQLYCKRRAPRAVFDFALISR